MKKRSRHYMARLVIRDVTHADSDITSRRVTRGDIR